MSDPIADPLNDPRVVAARARVTTVERTRERFADVTAETEDGSTAAMRIYGRFHSGGTPWGISASDVAEALDALPEGTERLDVHIHSRGGDAFEGLGILNLLRQAKPEVHTVVDGLAASAASAVAMAGKTITMSPSSQLMIHDASGIGVGQAEDMRILANALDSISDSYAAAYAQRVGGDPAEWRAAMQPETWYRADEAVKAGLADSVLAKPADEPKATANFDLSVFAYAGRDDAPDPFMPAARAPQTPAEPPETPPTETEEDAVMADTENKGLRERLGLAEDADEATLYAKVDELLEQATKPDPEPAPAAAASIPEGKVLVSQNVLDELKDMAQAGVQARAKQLADERDEAILAAFKSGKISAERKDHWSAAWDKDPEGTKADLESLPARFPVAKVEGYQGDDGSTGDSAKPFTDDEADALGALAGLPKGAIR